MSCLLLNCRLFMCNNIVFHENLHSSSLGISSKWDKFCSEQEAPGWEIERWAKQTHIFFARFVFSCQILRILERHIFLISVINWRTITGVTLPLELHKIEFIPQFVCVCIFLKFSAKVPRASSVNLSSYLLLENWLLGIILPP